MARQKGTLVLSANFETQAAAPLDARYTVQSESDLTASNSWVADGSAYVYVGMQVYVKANQKLFMLINEDYTKAASWTELSGIPASCLSYKGDVSTYANLPVSGMSVGDVYYVQDESANYYWSGSSWIALGSPDKSSFIWKTTIAIHPTVGTNIAIDRLKRIDDNTISATLDDIKLGKTIVSDASGMLAVAVGLTTTTTTNDTVIVNAVSKVYTQGNGIEIENDSIKVKVDSSNSNGLQSTASGLSLNTATELASGAMSAADKTKLNSLENYDDTEIVTELGNKVDKVTGKGLSTNDFTDALKQKLEDAVAYDDTAVRNLIDLKVDKVTGKGLSTNDFTDAYKDKLDGLENYDDTEIVAALDDKVDKVEGKGLSTEDYTTAEKTKLSGIEAGAEVNTIETVKVEGVALVPDANRAVNIDLADYTIIENETRPGYAKSYSLTKDNVAVGVTIEIPENSIIKSGTVGTVTVVDVPYIGARVGDKYIDLELETTPASHVYIPLKDIVVGYTEGNGISISGANQIMVKLDPNNSNGLVTASTGLGLNLATASSAGAMSALDKSKLNGLSNYDDTAILSALDGKVDKVTGKDLSTNDFTDSYKDKIDTIERGAQVNVINGIKVNGASVAPDANKVVGLTIPQSTSDLTNDANFVADANYTHTDNNYTNEDKAKLASLSSYDDSELRSLINAKQDELVSGTNIKTINNQSLLGSGNIDITGSAKLEETMTTDITVGHLASGTVFAVGTPLEDILRAILCSSGPAPVVNYTVSFNTSGGSAVASQVIEEGGKATRPATDPTKSGYTFDNWYTTSAYTTLFDFNSVITGDTVVYAKWTEIPATTYTVSFNTHGGSAVASQTVSDGGKATRPSPNPTKSGYTFDDWYTTDSYTTKFNFNTAITGNTTVHANWTAVVVTHTVTFYDMSGGTISTQTVNDGGTATRPADPTMTGYVFDNWYAESTFTNVFNFSTPITADTGVYAKFTAAPAVIPDLYICGFTNAEAKTAAIFATKTTEELLAGQIETHQVSEGTDYHRITTTFGTTGGTNNSIYYVMIKSGVSPTGAVMDTGSGDQIIPASQITDPSYWRATHDDVTINGYTYKVYGYRGRWNPTDTMGIKIA